MNLGVIGYGSRISGVIRGFILPLDGSVRIAAICDPRKDAIRTAMGKDGERITFYDDPDAMLDKESLDGVLVGTRCNLHTPMALKVMARNLPLYLEKPVAVTMEQVQALAAASQAYTAGCVVSFPLRLTPLVQRAKQLILDGAIGKLEHVQAVNNVPYGSGYFGSWYRDFDVTGGLFQQKATHDIDYISYLAEDRPRLVAAMLSRGRVFGGDKPVGLRCKACDRYETCPESPFWKYRKLGQGKDVGPGVPREIGEDHLCCFGSDIRNKHGQCDEDSSSCLIEFDSGLQAVYTQNFFVRREAGSRGATLVGYDGTIKFDWYTNKLTLIRHHVAEVSVSDYKDEGGHGGGDLELGYEFLRAMKGERETRSPLSAGIRSAITCLICRMSGEQHAYLKVPTIEELAAKGK